MGDRAKRQKDVSITPILPPELLHFLTRKSYSLLIKGEAATGKTILALSILKHGDERNNYLYLSTRVSPSQLFENHPWLAEIDASARPTKEVGGGQPQQQPQQPQQAPQEKVRDRFIDARLDEPVPFFERITNELMDVRSPTIIVDSWDPIATMMDGEALLSNIKVLQTWRERAEAKIITLIEDSSNSDYDSLFDGVVSLDRYYEDGRIVRMIELSKLSGVKVNRPSYLFTLDGGVFRSFSTYNPLTIDSGKRRTWVWEKRVQSTGYPEMDAILDGTLPPGTIVELSLGPGVNSKLLLLLLGRMLGGGKGSRIMLFRPFEGISLEQASEAIGKVMLIQRYRPGANKDGLVEALKKQVGKERERNLKVGALVGSKFLFEVESEEEQERLLELMKSDIDTTVIVGGSETASEEASRVADILLKLSDVNGTPLLQAQLPWTEYFALNADHGQATLSLVPMV